MAVVGVGHLGQHHARVCAELDGAALVGVSDTDEAQGREVARRHGVEFYPCCEDLLDKVDAVTVATPTVAHPAVAKAFLERGIPALVEKPLAASPGEAEDIVEAADRGGAILQVGHIERFNPAVRAVLGCNVRPVFIESHRMSPFRFRSVDVGVVFDLMIHDIDLARRFVGAEVEGLDAAGAAVISEHEDIASARLAFANGAVANITASRVSMESMRKTRLFSREGYYTVDCAAGTAARLRKGDAFRAAERKLAGASPKALAELKDVDFTSLVEADRLPVEPVEPLMAEIESFAQAVRTGAEPEVTGRDGLAAVKIAADVVGQIRERLKRLGVR